MIQALEAVSNPNPWARHEHFTFSADAKMVRRPLFTEEAPQPPTGGLYWYHGPQYLRQITTGAEYITTSDGSFMKSLRTTGMIVLFCLSTNDEVWARSVPTTPVMKLRFESDFKVGDSKPQRDQLKLAPNASDMIGQIRRDSGLTLELIAPLLGVSRRTIQSWKAGEVISLRNEERLRELAEAIKRLPSGNPRETKNLLLERVPGFVRIYDLLAERRFDDAMARAHRPEKPEPIHSDPSIEFQHPPIDSQLAIIEDEPSESAGQLNRKVSRRLKL